MAATEAHAISATMFVGSVVATISGLTGTTQSDQLFQTQRHQRRLMRAHAHPLDGLSLTLVALIAAQLRTVLSLTNFQVPARVRRKCALSDLLTHGAGRQSCVSTPQFLSWRMWLWRKVTMFVRQSLVRKLRARLFPYLAHEQTPAPLRCDPTPQSSGRPLPSHMAPVT